MRAIGQVLEPYSKAEQATLYGFGAEKDDEGQVDETIQTPDDSTTRPLSNPHEEAQVQLKVS